jgi:hypothetical protein
MRQAYAYEESPDHSGFQAIFSCREASQSYPPSCLGIASYSGSSVSRNYEFLSIDPVQEVNGEVLRHGITRLSAPAQL